jgi:predicted nucleic acid-binding protein
VAISAITILEAEPGGPARRRRDFVLSRLRIEPVTREPTLLAAELLHRTEMRGHQHAIDSVVAATALRPLSSAAPEPAPHIRLGSG